MADKQLRQLKRDELLGMLLEIEQENETLARENASLKKQLAERTLLCKEAGSIAEASLRLGDVFTAAQDAADIYLENIQRMAKDAEAENARQREKTKERCLAYAKAAAEQLELAGYSKAAEALIQDIRMLFETEGGKRRE